MAISLSVTLEEAALGCKKTISYDRLAPCEDCNGTGRAEGAQEKQCSRCHGTGYVTTVQRSFLGQVQSSSPCPDCHGEGTVIDHPCETCDGQGRTPSHEKIDIDIPAGVSTGRQLRVSGFGEAGLRGEPSGDLIVNVRVADHERFKRNGDDLYLVSDISIAQAALGCEIEVEGIMPDEVVKVTVPAGTQYGDTVSVGNSACPALAVAARVAAWSFSCACSFPRAFRPSSATCSRPSPPSPATTSLPARNRLPIASRVPSTTSSIKEPRVLAPPYLCCQPRLPRQPG